MTSDTLSQNTDVVAGSLVVVRDEEWLVTSVDHTQDGPLIRVRGLSELVRDTEAAFYDSLDPVVVLNPRETTVVADPSPGKSDRYLAHLRRTHWDAVVIDESHNVTNSATQNNRLASELAPRTDALILASATQHNGNKSLSPS